MDFFGLYNLRFPIGLFDHMALKRLFLFSFFGCCFLFFSGRLFAQSDSTHVDADTLNQMADSPADTSLSEKVVQIVKPYLPHVYTEAEKLRLKIPIPWRDDVIVPLPKGIQAAGPRPPYNPVMAWQRSMMLPGWGQAYNRSYWKMPIFYAGYIAAGAWIYYNQQWYSRLQIAYLNSLDLDPFNDDPQFSNYDSEGLRNLREQFRDRRDQAILIAAGWHLVQVAEAYVDAHMKGYDISEDLSYQKPIYLKPALSWNNGPGFGISLRF